MVPFYGQGLNCGLEDVRVLNSLLRKNGVFRASEDPDILAVKMNAALMEYSTTRHEDLVAICDLAMDN
jgi:kynurenine 3-monooxygenase